MVTIVIFDNFIAKAALYEYVQDNAPIEILPVCLVARDQSEKDKICERIQQTNIKIFYQPNDMKNGLSIRDLLVQNNFASVEKYAIIEKCNDRIIMKLTQEHIDNMPGGQGYQEAKKHFETLSVINT